MEKIGIKMKETRRGSQDGVTIQTFEKDEYYFVERNLAKVFIDNDWAVRRVKKIVEAESVEVAPEEENENLRPDEDPRPMSIQDTKPKEWIGRTLRNVESGELKKVVSAQGNQIFFEGEEDGVDYRLVRKTMEVI